MSLQTLVRLPAEVTTMVESIPMLPSLGDEQLGSLTGLVKDQLSLSSVVVTKDMPPMSSKMLEKIHKWEYVDLSITISYIPILLPVESLMSITVSGQMLATIVNLPDQHVKKQKVITDIQSWAETYSIYVCSCSHFSWSHYQKVGLLAHVQYTLLKLAKNSWEIQWLHYDQAFREWVADREVRVWGDLNLSIFSHCLATQQGGGNQARVEMKPVSSPYTRSVGCRPWNFKKVCIRKNYHFHHSCYHCDCGWPHNRSNFPSGSSKSYEQFYVDLWQQPTDLHLWLTLHFKCKVVIPRI